MVFINKKSFEYEECSYYGIRYRAFDKLSKVYCNDDFTDGLESYKRGYSKNAHDYFDRLVTLGVNHSILLFLHVLTEDVEVKRKSEYMYQLIKHADD